MSTYTVFWSIDVELESGASLEDHARYAAEICRGMDLRDPGAPTSSTSRSTAARRRVCSQKLAGTQLGWHS